MSWNDITITDAGRTLLAEMINGGKLAITRIAIGSETVSATELHSQTNVSEPINAPALLAGKSPTEDGSGTVLKIQIRNDEVSESVRMRQIGIYAETDSADEVLLALLQDNIGEEIPSYSEFPQFELNQWITLAISRTNNIAVTIDPASVVITLEQLNEALKGYVEKAEGMVLSENNFTDELKEKYDGAHEHISQMDNPHSVTKSQVGLENVPNVATNDQTPTYTEAETLAALTSGEKLSAAFGKISKAIKGFIAHLGDNARHITAAERTAWNGKAAGSHNHDSRYYTEGEMNAKLAGKAASAHKHSASDISSGVLPVSMGGTGNSTGYITIGQKGGTTLGAWATAAGYGTEATNNACYSDGFCTKATGMYAHASGYYTHAKFSFQHVTGKYNNPDAGGHWNYALLVVGNGSNENERSNCFRAGSAGVYGGTYNSTGADYAEYFEWLDGNPNKEDRRGLIVTLEGEKIRIANPGDDYILGIVSGNPSIVGDSHDDQWNKMYVSDIFGTPVYEEVEVSAETDEDGNVLVEAHNETRQKVNPDYDSSQKYVPRSERPEWDAVGMMGKLVAVDDGSCRVNGYCQVGENGTAVHSDEKTKFRVMKRLDSCHILVLVV